MKILNTAESKAALVAGKVRNADCATPGALDLPDGNPDAERVCVSTNRKTGATVFDICAPWLLADTFSL